MLKRLARLFTIKTRWEAFALTYAIAVGAVERGLHFLEVYPGNIGLFMAVACLGVPFIAGAKLLDSVRPAPVPAVAHKIAVRPPRRRAVTRSRPRFRPTHSAARSRRSLRTD